MAFRRERLPNTNPNSSGGTYRSSRTCSSRVNLSTFNNRTTAAALKRNGQVCLALDAGAYRLDGQEWRGGNSLRSASVKPVLSASISAATPVATPVFPAVFCSIFGGSPSVGTPAPQGLATGAFRMHAPLSLGLGPVLGCDQSANQQEGDA